MSDRSPEQLPFRLFCQALDKISDGKQKVIHVLSVSSSAQHTIAVPRIRISSWFVYGHFSLTKTCILLCGFSCPSSILVCHNTDQIYCIIYEFCIERSSYGVKESTMGYLLFALLQSETYAVCADKCMSKHWVLPRLVPTPLGSWITKIPAPEVCSATIRAAFDNYMY